MQIEKQIKRINTHVFVMTTLIKNQGHNNTTPVKCPKCNFDKLMLHVEYNHIRMNCKKCLYEEYYMRIVKRGEDSI